MEKKLLGERARNIQDSRDQDVFLAGALAGGDSGKQASGYGPSVTYRRIHFSKQEGFQPTFLLINPDGETDSTHDIRILHRLSDPTPRRKRWRLTLFVLGPDREPVREAGVIFSISCPHNVHELAKGTAGQLGYHFEFAAAHDGVYRVEAKISIRGQFLADGFTFETLQGKCRRSS